AGLGGVLLARVSAPAEGACPEPYLSRRIWHRANNRSRRPDAALDARNGYTGSNADNQGQGPVLNRRQPGRNIIENGGDGKRLYGEYDNIALTCNLHIVGRYA